MSDKDREAFEKWFPVGRELLEYPNSGDAPTGFKAGWQAASDHYAPKLTEKAVVEALESRAEPIEPQNDDGVSSGKLMIGISEAITALRAAGIRFREEA